jgi:hypothetical protein
VVTITTPGNSYGDFNKNSTIGPGTIDPTPASQVAITNVPTGGAPVTYRELYRTKIGGGAALFLQQTIANNTATAGVTDSTPDASLGATAPASDSSGLKQPEGQILPGASSIVVAGVAPFSSGGGWAIIGNGEQVVRFTGISGNTLIGLPPTGPGAVLAAVSYNTTITAAPALVGVTGLALPLIQGAPVNIWVQRDDLAAQAALHARDGTDGVIEHVISDERRGEGSLNALCDADLQRFSTPLKTVVYGTRDIRTKSGKPITFNLASPAISDTLTIQDVTITELGIAPRLLPKFVATASNVRFSLEDLLRRMANDLGGT